MIQISQLKLKLPHTEKELDARVRKTLKINKEEKIKLTILHRSIDGRKKPELFEVFTVGVELKNKKKEESLLKKAPASVSVYKPVIYQIPKTDCRDKTKRPVVIGAGPAGLFCAFLLTEAGIPPIVVERGKPVEERQKDVENFWKTGVLDPSSNVQFGEGGAGTFSDGKLNTSVKDPSGRNHMVLETLVRFGAPSDILCDAKPHIGTDILAVVIANMRTYLVEKGCTFLFHTCVEDFILEDAPLADRIADPDAAKRLAGLVCNGKVVETDRAVIAIGHSSRDTFRCLYQHGVPMEQKNFAVGFRVEHPQNMINEALYGVQPDLKLPAAPYKVTANFNMENGSKRGVYSFCMCPGGYVVNSSSEKEGTVVNGMSYSGRNSRNANSAIIVSVSSEDFGSNHPLAGIAYQQKLEHEVWTRGNGAIPQQLFGDFRQGVISTSYGDYDSVTKGKTTFAPLGGLLSPEMEAIFCRGMDHFGKVIPGFDRKDAILSGMESRTSSPVRILRDQSMQSDVKGLYPCGEGAGYAGGITSAAIDGLKVAEAIISEVNNC